MVVVRDEEKKKTSPNGKKGMESKFLKERRTLAKLTVVFESLSLQRLKSMLCSCQGKRNNSDIITFVLHSVHLQRLS